MIQITKVLTLIVFGLLFFNLSAQDNDFNNDPNAKLPEEDRKFRFGLQFSPNVSWLKTNTTGYKSGGSELGFSYGLSFEYFLTKNYLFSTGINLLKVGGNLSYEGVILENGTMPVSVKQDYTIKYIEVPLLLKLRTNEIGYLTYFGEFGLNAGFNYKSSAKYGYSYTTEFYPAKPLTPFTSNDISEEINWINLSLVVVAGVEYNISGNTSIMLGITFNNGFINQLDTKVHLLDSNGDALIDSDGNPVYSEKDVSANLNYIALNIGIYF
ncbi:MAG: hypothetical protein COA97_00425 [Flavobacteriales bacterium]|nr:MAG: hypothetical protein COA97_00425 [Flavobacteriales bacterium]